MDFETEEIFETEPEAEPDTAPPRSARPAA